MSKRDGMESIDEHDSKRSRYSDEDEEQVTEAEMEAEYQAGWPKPPRPVTPSSDMEEEDIEAEVDAEYLAVESNGDQPTDLVEAEHQVQFDDQPDDQVEAGQSQAKRRRPPRPPAEAAGIVQQPPPAAPAGQPRRGPQESDMRCSVCQCPASALRGNYYVCASVECLWKLDATMKMVDDGAHDKPRETPGKKVHSATKRAVTAKNQRRDNALIQMLAPKPVSYSVPGDESLFMLTHDPEADEEHPNRVPDLNNGFYAVDANDKRVHVPPLHWSRFLLLAFSCAAGKNYQMLGYMKTSLSEFPMRAVLVLSSRRIHAGELLSSLKGSLDFLCYLDDSGSSKGMPARIKKHIDYCMARGVGPRVICSINLITALPNEFVDYFIGNKRGLVVHDEPHTASGFIRCYGPGEKPMIAQPDATLNTLQKICKDAINIGCDADAPADGTCLDYIRRVAPGKDIYFVENKTHTLQRTMRIAIGKVTDNDDGKSKVDQVGRNSFLQHLYAAVAGAMENVDGRVFVHCATVGQIEAIQRNLQVRGLWNDQGGCKVYIGKSYDDVKAELNDPKQHWENTYLVLVNSVVTIGVNIDMPFGAAFMITSNASHVALLRDQLQGIVRIWRKPDRLDLMPQQGMDGYCETDPQRCYINVLLDCKPPDSVAALDAHIPKNADSTIAPADFPVYLQSLYEAKLKSMRRDGASAQAAYSTKLHASSLQDVTEGTARLMAWNYAERRANSSHHFAYFVYLVQLSTRGMQIELMKPWTGAMIEPVLVPEKEVEEETEPSDVQEDEEESLLMNIDKLDSELAPLKDDLARYRKFLAFIEFHIAVAERVRGVGALGVVTVEFFRGVAFGLGGDKKHYTAFVRGLGIVDDDTPVNNGNGETLRLMEEAFHALRPIQRIVFLSNTDTPANPLTVLSRQSVVLARRTELRLFRTRELLERKVHVQNSVQHPTLWILQQLQFVATKLQLTIEDLLGFEPGCDDWDIQADPYSKTLQLTHGVHPLDFTPRQARSDANAPQTFCGGRWGYAGDVDERGVMLMRKLANGDEDLTESEKAMGRTTNAVRHLASKMGVSVQGDSKALRVLSDIMKNTVGVELKRETKRGQNPDGSKTTQLTKLTRVVIAEDVAKRWHMWYAEKRSAPAWETRDKIIELVAEDAMRDLPSGFLDDDFGGSGEWMGPPDNAMASRLSTLCNGIAENNTEPTEPQHWIPVDVDAIDAATGDDKLLLLRTIALDNDDRVVGLATERDDDRVRCVSLATGTMPSDTTLDDHNIATAVGSLCDRLMLDDTKLPGALPIRLLEREVVAQRKKHCELNVSSKAVVDFLANCTDPDAPERVLRAIIAPGKEAALPSALKAVVVEARLLIDELINKTKDWNRIKRGINIRIATAPKRGGGTDAVPAKTNEEVKAKARIKLMRLLMDQAIRAVEDTTQRRAGGQYVLTFDGNDANLSPARVLAAKDNRFGAKPLQRQDQDIARRVELQLPYNGVAVSLVPVA